MTILIAIFSFVLVLLCLFTLLVVMVQKPKGDGGMGAALGGGSMEAALGAETSSLLTRITIYAVIGFFLLTFSLYLGNIYSKKGATEEENESLLSEIVDETAADASNAPEANSALQQVLQLNEGQEEVAEQAEAASQDLEAAAEEVQAEVEEKVNQ
jgi:preprotein translocase subunit SecG